jgi:hypothetical protein
MDDLQSLGRRLVRRRERDDARAEALVEPEVRVIKAFHCTTARYTQVTATGGDALLPL